MMRAVDAIWWPAADNVGLVSLREHVIRLCFAASEVEHRSGGSAWAAIANNLHMAASLTDVDADTDLRGGSFMCNAAADFEEAFSEITRKHLAGVIVFNLCWTAYEGAVEIVSAPLGLRQPKGARGRELLRNVVQASRLPHLQECLRASLEFEDGSDSELSEFRALLADDALAAAAAELMRFFRNRVVHGALQRPEPQDWGAETDYVVDDDPVIVRFRHHIRLVLLLTQILMIAAVDRAERLPSWSDTDKASSEVFGGDSKPAAEVLQTLHCNQLSLPLFELLDNDTN